MKSTIELSSIETINRLLSDIFSTFPSVYNSKTDPSDKVFLNVVNPLMERSTYLCKAINNGKLEIKKSAQGGQSVAGPFQITLYKRGEAYVLDIFIASISFKTSGGWTPYMMPLIAKTARRPLYSSCGLGSDRKKGCAALLKMSVTRNNGVIIYVSSDTIHEATVGALTSHLFDIGVAPSLMKYLGLYTCPELNTYILADHLEMGAIPYILMEKSDVELFSLLDMTNVNRVLPNINDEFYAQKKQAQEDAALNINLFDQLNILDFIIIFSQVAHALYVMKYHFNICHYDLHLRNIMLTYTKKVLKYKKNITELSYDGKPLNQVEHYIYQMPFKDGNYPAFLVVENNGLLPKIIDFGHTTASFTHEGIPLKFQNTPEEYDQLNFPEDKLKYYGWDSTWNVTHALNSENKGDLEYNFLLLNFLYKLTLNAGVDRYENIIKNQTFLNFIKSTLPFGPEDIKKSFTGIEKAHSDGKLWLMRKRSVGTTSNIEAPLQKIWKFLTQNVSRQIIDNKVYIVLNRNGENKGKFNIATSVYVPISNNPNLSNMNKFFMANKMLWKDCIINPPKNQKDVSERALKFGLPKDTNVCSKDGLLDISVQKYDPNSKLYLPFFDKIVDGASTSFWNGSMLAKMILPSQMKNFERLNLGKGQIRLYTLKFLPEFTNMNMALEPYHRDVERKMPKNAGDLMKNLNMHLIYINDFPSSSNIRNHFIKISVEKEDLFSTSLEKLQNVKYGVSINGGYFVVGGNINNELTPGLQEKHLRPIGFFFSILAPQYNGTVLPIPKPYKKDFATVYINKEGRLRFMKSIDFLKLHNTEESTFLVEKSNGEIVADKQDVIKMVYDKSAKMMVPVTKDDTFRYVSAFESGPILIWDGKIIFTKDKMLEEEFQYVDYDSTRNKNVYTNYKLFKGAKNYKIWFNEPGESEFMYGARHSNSLMIHNVLCRTNNDETLIILVEGRGFDAVGIDRVQLSELINHFNVKHAVSLDGGFSGNAVFRFNNRSYWLMNDPDKRTVATSIHFGSN